MSVDLRFYIEINAPDGLRGIEQHWDECDLPLEPYLSGYNRKVILREAGAKDDFHWHMDSSDTEIMVASGVFRMDVTRAWAKLESLSRVLRKAGFPFRIGLDDEDGTPAHESMHQWKEE